MKEIHTFHSDIVRLIDPASRVLDLGCGNGALLKAVMAAAGFVKVERLPIDHPYFADPVPWQVGYMGVKP